MNYIEFSQKIKNKYPEYRDMDDRELAERMVAKYPDEYADVEFGNIEPTTQNTNEPKRPKRIDLTPAGLFKGSQNVVASALASPIVANRENISIPEAYKQNMERVQDYRQENPTPFQDFAIDTATYSLLPAARGAGLGARALTGLGQGALIGGLEGLKEGQTLRGAGMGGALGAAINGTLPPVVKGIGKAANKAYLNAFPGLKEEVVKRLINPASKALDLDEIGAQQLLTNTTERVRDAYNRLLTDKGNVVGRLLHELPETRFKSKDIAQDFDKIYNNYSLSKNEALNPARNATTKELGKIEEMLGGDKLDKSSVTPQELYDINKNISNMVDWNKADSAMKNDVLEQMYGANAERISNLSPALKDANTEYSKLMDFKKNEGIRPILNNGEKIDQAASALKNYKGNISQGNRNRNINDLENMLVEGGYTEPFLNEIDDVNTANELLKTVQTGFNPFGLTDTLKNVVETPILKASRGVNRMVENIPQKYKAVGQKIPDAVRKLLTIGAAESLPLKAGIEYNDYQY